MQNNWLYYAQIRINCKCPEIAFQTLNDLGKLVTIISQKKHDNIGKHTEKLGHIVCV